MGTMEVLRAIGVLCHLSFWEVMARSRASYQRESLV